MEFNRIVFISSFWTLTNRTFNAKMASKRPAHLVGFNVFNVTGFEDSPDSSLLDIKLDNIFRLKVYFYWE